jgi:hypothetical protein
MFYCVVNEDIYSNPVAAFTTITTRFKDVDFYTLYRNITTTKVYNKVDRHLRINLF